MWDVSPSILTAEVQALRKHKEWADKKIDFLIRRVKEAEGPHRSLKEEVRQLRLVRLSRTLEIMQYDMSPSTIKHLQLIISAPIWG